MKRSLPLVILFLLISISKPDLKAQCTLSISATDTTICYGDSVTLTANTAGPDNSLVSTLAAGNNHRGNMFDVTATNTLTITSFEAHPMGNTTIAVYYRTTPYAGFETSSAGWTLIGSAAVIAQPFGNFTPVPVPVNVLIPAGQTYSFYVTSTNIAVSLNYTDGTSEGAPYTSDANLIFRQGVGMEYPFSNGSGVFRPRVWNGKIHYTVPTTTSYLWSTGSTNQSITVGPTTTTPYTVNVNISGCSTLNGSQNITVGNPVVDLGADQSECLDGNVMLDAGTFTSYSWNTTETTQTIILDGVTIGAGTNAYTATVTDAIGCTDTDTVNITFNALPTVDLGSDQNVCTNDSLLLDAGAGFTSYTWSTSANTQTQMVNSSFGLGTTEFSVTVVDANTCSNADTIVLTLVSPPSVDLGADDTICYSGSVLLDAGAGSFSYLWTDGTSTQTFNALGTNLGVGTHSIFVTVTDGNSCNGYDAVLVNVIADPNAAMGSDPTICVSGTTILSVTPGAASYLWSNGATTSSINVDGSVLGIGTHPFSVEVTNSFGCTSADTVTVNVISCLGINENNSQIQMNVYPNPATDIINLNINSEMSGEMHISILNEVGQPMLVQKWNCVAGNQIKQMDVSNLSAGIYLVQIELNGHLLTRKMVIN